MPRLSLEGGYVLKGEVTASGSKNAALPLLAATILMDGECTLSNVPDLHDIATMIKMLNALNLRVEYGQNHQIKIWNTKKVRHIAPYDLVTAMRASFFVAGPVLAKTGFAKIPLPGGCSIGSRPIDLHLKGFKAMGASVRIEHGFVELQAKKLVGTRFYMDFPSVGATENIMMAATLAVGRTIIENAAQEPEITDLANFLIEAGAIITGLGTSTITIDGVESLKGTSHKVIPDRIESGTLLIAGAITKGDVVVHDAIPEHIEPLIQKLREIGFGLEVHPEKVRIFYQGHINSVDFETLPFPGFPTDMQAQMMSLLCIANGTSVITESIFENRFMHANELMRMGANIKLNNQSAIITGVPTLSGAEVKITDLRAGAALILAGLAADGTTTVHGLKHLRRGYENLPEKLTSLGAKILPNG
jgi:UDP-N-acetylglucosamine 1-carboxyvinyltransferase